MIKFYHQLSFRQARIAVLAGFLIGMIVSLIQISSDLLKERKQFDSIISQVVSMVRDSAAQAVYDIDSIQAEKVVNGLFRYKPFYDAKITDEDDSILASVNRPMTTGRLDWLVTIIFGQEKIYEEALFFGDDKRALGSIRVKVDSYIIAVNFIDRAIMIITGGIVRNLILACIFTVLFYYTLTRPLLRMVKSVSLVDPDNPADKRVEHPQGHKNDEMGLLVRTINRLLKGFDDSLTRQREAERKVSEREAFIRGIMDNVPDGILTISEKGLTESCNSSAENLFGYRADELAGFSPDQLINEPERSLLHDIIDSYLKSGDSEKLKQAPGEASALHRDSTSFPLEIRLNEMHLRERCIIICVLSDISERKQNEELKTENLRMSTELDVTRRLQQMILPTPDELQQIEGLDIVGYMKPAAEVGGDYYDVLRHNGSVKIGIGDVTGHGLESGVLMLMTQTAVRTLLTSGEKDPARFLDI
ncbi:MAG: PAS domain S-box protein, partial [Desulfobacteraceae bacterium]|nr:PAS domain S-box protein [Desulfobacteraceae bacterium]